jgi:phytoene synthase
VRRALAARARENFPVGSRFVARRLRPHFVRVYVFARAADDLADEHGDAAALAELRAGLLREVAGRSGDPLWSPLAETIREFGLPVQCFTDLVDAFAQDLRKRRYEDLDELIDYCTRSADPVGRIVLRLFGHASDELDRLSDRICTALQLVNHLRDVREDLVVRDRVYLPRSWLAEHGVSEQSIREGVCGAGFVSLARRMGALCADLFAAGWPLTERLAPCSALEIRAIVHGGCEVLRRCIATPALILHDPPRLSGADHVEVLLRALVSRRMPRGVAGRDARDPRIRRIRS